MSAGRRTVCGNHPCVELSDGDRQEVEDFKAWLLAREDGTLDEQIRAAAEYLRPSSRSAAVVLQPAVADAVAELLVWCSRGTPQRPYEAFLVARRILGGVEDSAPVPGAER